MKIFFSVVFLILVLSTCVVAQEAIGTYTPANGLAVTFQTYWNDGPGVGNPDVYGDGPLEVGNVIMGWNSIFPNSLWDLCPNTLVGTVDPATDLIITNVSPDPPVTGPVNVTYFGGQLRLDGSLWGGSGKYMVDLNGASGVAYIDLSVPGTFSMDFGFSANGTLKVGNYRYSVEFSANFSDSVSDDMSGFSGTPSDVMIIISSPVPAENTSWGRIKAINR